MSGRNVYALWHEFPTENANQPDVFLSRSTNRGDDFGDRENLSNSPDLASEDEQIAVSGRNVYVVWTEENTGIVFARSTDRGEDFDKETLRKDNDATSPQIAVSGNNVYVVWQEGPAGNEDVYFKRSTDGGEDFDPREKLSKIGQESKNPRIDVSGNNVYVVWQEGPGMADADIFFRASNDRGEDFDDKKNLSDSPAAADDPSIVASGGNAYVVWRDNRVAGQGYDIFFNRGD